MDDDFTWQGPLPAPDFTMVPNLVFDTILPHLSGVEAKVLLLLVRATYGWHRQSVELSLADIVQRAGVGRGSAQDALRALERVGLVQREQRSDPVHGHTPTVYWLRVTDDARYNAQGYDGNRDSSDGNRAGYPGSWPPSPFNERKTRKERRSTPTERPHDPADYTSGRYGHRVEP